MRVAELEEIEEKKKEVKALEKKLATMSSTDLINFGKNIASFDLDKIMRYEQALFKKSCGTSDQKVRLALAIQIVKAQAEECRKGYELDKTSIYRSDFRVFLKNVRNRMNRLGIKEEIIKGLI